jgi:hypothetical protein
MLRILVGVILAVVGVAGAWAEETGGVQISGNANVVGIAKDVSTIAVGTDNRAITRIGVIKPGTNVGGGTSVTAVVGGVANVAAGRGTTGCVELGVVGPAGSGCGK